METRFAPGQRRVAPKALAPVQVLVGPLFCKYKAYTPQIGLWARSDAARARSMLLHVSTTRG